MVDELFMDCAVVVSPIKYPLASTWEVKANVPENDGKVMVVLAVAVLRTEAIIALFVIWTLPLVNELTDLTLSL